MHNPQMQHDDQRVAVFIDVQNMYHSARNLYSARVSFREVVRAAVAGRHLIRSFAYVVRTKTGEEKPFFEALEKEGIEMRVKDLQEFYGGAKKADWDVGMAIDAVRTADIVDVIVIVSGDGDFLPLLDYLKGRGRRVEVIAFGRSASQRMKEAADDFLDLEEEPKRFLIRSRRLGGRTASGDRTAVQESS
ncbi:MAG: NYN domain-containing protein [Candidatus Sungbacteria bacterium]|uniref:NYN domain-containing protein n=1 Tax=Candidatus Sungiibacteriota bacterium TaxID=2750080 RepID=A0A932YXT9_9BACT|nr:NYN domain-containing protein [Candidatus Sungbacteria bacterium]